jgi:hypothetical protein
MANQPFNQMAFAGNNAFYLGSSGLLAGNNQAVARAQLNRAAGIWTPAIIGLAPDNIQVNAIAAAAGQNPLTGTVITKMALGNGNLPVVAIDPTSAQSLAGTNAPWNQAGVAWSQLGGIANAATAADPAQALINAAAIVFIVDEDNGQVLVNGGTNVGLAAAAADDTKNLNLLHTNDVNYVTNPIFGLAATNQSIIYDAASDAAQFVFAGVAATPDFSSNAGGSGKNGVALMRVEDDQLVAEVCSALGAADDPVHNVAASLTPDVIQIAGPPSYVAPAGLDIYWDDPLQRLFVALKGVQTNATNRQGAVGVAIGRFDAVAQTFALSPVPNDVPHFTAGNPNFIIGYVNSAGTNTQTIDLYKIRIMHTSTGNNYMILNGGVVANGDTKNSEQSWVFALPIVGGAGAAAADVGKPASIDFNASGLHTVHFNTVAASAPHMTKVDRTAAITPTNGLHAVVGANPSYLAHNWLNLPVAINDIHVVGDTVYVSVSGSRDATNQQEIGIFASTAIFNQAGAIRAWTPWQRVMGNIADVYGFGFDERGSNYWFTDPSKAYIKVTRWDAGDAVFHPSTGPGNGPLSAALQPYFAESFQGGVYGLFNFDDETPGFQAPTAANFPSFSMMVATGYNCVAMIQTGAADSTGVFQQTTTYYTTPQTAPAAQNVFIFAPPALPDLGAITVAEVARVAPGADPAASAGWLFVGGERGVAVLRYTALGGYEGTGWPNDVGQGLAGLVGVNPDDYPGGSNYAWVALTPPAGPAPANVSFTNIRKLASDGTFLYVLTRNTLYRIVMNAADFVNGTLSAANLQTVTSVGTMVANDGATHLLDAVQDEFFDMLVLNNTVDTRSVLLATSDGLYSNIDAMHDNGDNLSNKFALAKNSAGTASFDKMSVVLRLDFVSQLRGGQFDGNGLAQGNLYALAIDTGFTGLNVYRFNVAGTAVNAFAEPYGGPANPTDYFYQIGSIANLAPHEFSGLLDFVNYTRYFGDLPTYFVDNMPVLPPTASFLQTTNPINFGADLTHGLHLGTKVMDTASGAVYVPGEFGVRVNE